MTFCDRNRELITELPPKTGLFVLVVIVPRIDVTVTTTAAAAAVLSSSVAAAAGGILASLNSCVLNLIDTCGCSGRLPVHRLICWVWFLSQVACHLPRTIMRHELQLSDNGETTAVSLLFPICRRSTVIFTSGYSECAI